MPHRAAARAVALRQGLAHHGDARRRSARRRPRPRLLGVEGEALTHAFGLAGTQAAGLKSCFGTMSKPLHPGKAAQNGLLAARLAARGFTSDTDVLASTQGFAATQSTTAEPAAGLDDRAQPWVVEALFKYHAACYLTHDSIEAANALRVERRACAPDEIEAVSVKVPAGHLGVCNIQAPTTGLECKFSLRDDHRAGASGEDTFQEALFSDATARRARSRRAARAGGDRSRPRPAAAAIVTVRLKDGRALTRAPATSPSRCATSPPSRRSSSASSATWPPRRSATGRTT